MEGIFESPSWDIKGVYFDFTPRGGFTIGLDTVGGFLRHGGQTSAAHKTELSMVFSGWPSGGSMTFDLVLTDTTGLLWFNGAPANLLAWIPTQGVWPNDWAP